MFKKPFLLIPVVLILLSVSVCFATADKSLQAAQDKITALIDAKNFDAAQAAIDKMAADFAGDELLGRRIWEDANRYDKREAFEYAKVLCARVVADWPDDSYASSYASLLLARLNIYEQIDAGDCKSADSAVSKMLDDFAGHSQLARRVWEVANRYDKVRAYNYSKDLCTRIIAEFPDDLYASYAALQSAKLDVYKLIDAGRCEDANSAVSDIIKNFKGHKQHSRRLYEIAKKFAQKGERAYAGRLYGQIAAAYPKDEYGLRADFQYKMGIYSTRDDAKVEIDKTLTAFENNSYFYEGLSEVIGLCCEEYYNTGETLLGGSQPGNKSLRTITEGLEYYVQKREKSGRGNEADMYYRVGGDFETLGEYSKAVRYLTKAADTDPNFERVVYCLSAIGQCYERMAEAGTLPKDHAIELAKESYLDALDALERNPDDAEKDSITDWLKQHENQ